LVAAQEKDIKARPSIRMVFTIEGGRGRVCPTRQGIITANPSIVEDFIMLVSLILASVVLAGAQNFIPRPKDTKAVASDNYAGASISYKEVCFHVSVAPLIFPI
jgi:hypothetical protein